MAARSLQSLHHHHPPLKRHHSDASPPPFFLNARTSTTPLSSLPHSLSSPAAPFSLSSATSSAPYTSPAVSFDQLELHLSAGNFRQADEETRRLLIVLAGDAAQKRGYVYFSEVQFISIDDLRAIDNLWTKYSGGKFGYSVQKKVFEKVNRDFTNLFRRIGWMKKLDTEIEQFNYRSFPTEFVWELSDDAPEGHLPLTNALRGTQLMANILSHPAFEDMEKDGEKGEGGEIVEGITGSENGGLKGAKFARDRVFKTDYSF